MRRYQKKSVAKQHPHPNSYAIKRFGMKPAQKQLVSSTETNDLPIEMASNGFIMNGQLVDLSQWVPDWQSLKHTFAQLPSSTLQKIIAGAVAFTQMQLVAAESKLCFQDTHNNTGVGVVHMLDTAGPLAQLPGDIKRSLITEAQCGVLSELSCTQDIMGNVTKLFDYMYHAPKLVKDCMQASMTDVGHFAKTDDFHQEHVYCIWQNVHGVLSEISQSEQQKLLPKSGGNTTGMVFGILFAIALVGGVTACLLRYRNRHGHFPFSDNIRNGVNSLFSRGDYDSIGTPATSSASVFTSSRARLG